MTENVTQEFHSELDEKWQVWLTKRFIRYCVFSLAAIVLTGFGTVLYDLYQLEHGEFSRYTLAFAISNIPIVVLLIGAILTVKRKSPDRQKLLRAITWTVAIYGLFGIIISPILEWYYSSAYGIVPFAQQIKPSITIFGVLTIHLLACFFIPWPPREAVKAVVPLWVIAILMIWFAEPDFYGERILWSFLVIIAGLPGLLFCYGRAKKYESEFYINRLSGRYSDLKRELQAARQIQGLLFPEPVTEGEIQLKYLFEPMQQIGGDFIYIRTKKDEQGNTISLTATLIDVTGHGITAALAVTRLHGELERLYAEEINASPARVIRALNKYIYLTIAKQGIYATGISIQYIAKTNTLIWANAGHPSAYILHDNPDTPITPLPTTCMMLGVLNDDAYSSSEEHHKITATDRVFAYTDGIIEAKNKEGKMLNNQGLEQILNQIPHGESIDILEEVFNQLKSFRSGAADDDVLMLDLTPSSQADL